MYTKTIDEFTALAQEKMTLLRKAPLAFVVSSLQAGAYVGIGIVLIFVVGEAAPPAFRKLVMGASFGIALTLVIIAGADLFTGHNMYGTFARLSGRLRSAEVGLLWLVCWVGNLLGSIALALLVTAGGAAGLHAASDGLLQSVASYKMTSPAEELVARAVLCNWLVCLAIWMAWRVRNEVAKCIVIWWCLFAFIACGFEHSVANMALLSLALLGPAAPGVTWGGMGHNLLWATLGNVIGGALFVAGSYWVVTRRRPIAVAPPSDAVTRRETA
jgi:nitrite transporter NirC